MKREEIVEVIKALMGDDLDEQVRVVKGVFSHFCNVDSAAKDAVTSAFMSAEIETEKCLEAFWKRVLKHEQDSVKYLDFNCSEDSVREQRIVEVLMFLLMHCGPSGLVLIPDLSKLLRVEEVDPRFRLYRLESVACSALASMDEHAIAEFETIYSYVLKENELSGKAWISMFCKFDESILERIMNDVRELEDELIVDRVDLLSYVARENDLENREDIKELFVGLLKSDDEDVVYAAIEHLNATALDDEDIQNLINEVQSKIDEEEDDVINAADFDYVYEGEPFAYWLDLFMFDRKHQQACDVVLACFHGYTDVDYLESKQLEEVSHGEKLRDYVKIWVEQHKEVASEVYEKMLKGLCLDMDYQDLGNPMTEEELKKSNSIGSRKFLGEDVLKELTPFVPDAIRLLEEVKSKLIGTRNHRDAFSKLVAASNFLDSSLPQELVQHWLSSKHDHWPNEYTNSIVIICTKEPSLLRVVKAAFVDGGEDRCGLISDLICQMKGDAICLLG